MTLLNNKECIETKKDKYTITQWSKLKQVYCFKVREERKQTQVLFAGEIFNKVILLLIL